MAKSADAAHRNSFAALAQQIDQVAYAEQPEVFFAAVRDSDIPYMCLHDQVQDAEQAYLRLLEAVYYLGRASLPLTVGLTMHLYATHGLCYAPLGETGLAKKRLRILQDLAKHKLLLAVSTFSRSVEGDSGPGVRLKAEGPQYQVSGQTVFQSLATAADLVAFTGADENDELHYFLVPLKEGRPPVPGQPVFSGPMEHTDTRGLSWDGLALPVKAALLSGSDDVFRLLHYQTIWFQGLISAAYLGAYSRALDLTRIHLLEKQNPPPDHWVLALGRLGLGHRHAVGLVRRLADVIKIEDPDRVVEVLDCSSVVKYQTAETVQEGVRGITHLLGAAAAAPTTLIGRLCQQLPYLRLQPMSPQSVELDFGYQLLDESVFVGLRF